MGMSKPKVSRAQEELEKEQLRQLREERRAAEAEKLALSRRAAVEAALLRDTGGLGLAGLFSAGGQGHPRGSAIARSFGLVR